MAKPQLALTLSVIFSCAVSFAQDAAVAAEAKKEVAAESAANAGGGVVIVTQQAAPQVIEQPTTVVTASPLTTSRADEMRKQRERMEVENEQKIVEKLEASRMEDEQKRLNNLFGNGQQQQEEQKVEAAPVVVAPVVAAPVVPQKSEEELKSEIASQVRADLEAAKAAEETKKRKARWSVGGILSTLDYPDAINVGSDFGAGAVINWMGPDRLGVEIAAVFSQATIDQSYSAYKEIDQQNWMITPKYYFFDRQITPVVGGIVSFTHREYSDIYNYYYTSYSFSNTATTDSLDVGLLIGLQFSPSKNISFGLDYRWLTNVESRYSDPRAFNRSIFQHSGGGYKPLEEINYQFIGMSMNFMF